MSNTFFISDTHFGHANILNFKRPDGKPLREFNSIEEHDETIINNWNRTVSDKDRVYHMGDVTLGRRHLSILSRLKGRKKLIRGNHDVFKLKDYTPYFEDIVSYRIYPTQGLIFSHIPVYEDQLDHRFKFNCHGHTHGNSVLDPRYINLCVEWTNYTPVSFDEVLDKINWDKNTNSYRG